MDAAHFHSVEITISDHTIEMHFDQDPEEFLSEMATAVNLTIDSQNLLATADKGCKNMKSLNKKIAKLNDVIDKCKECKTLDVFIASVFCIASLVLIAAAISCFVFFILVLALPLHGLILPAILLFGLGMPILGESAVCLSIFGVSYENMGDSKWIAGLIPPLARFVQIFADLSVLDNKKDQLTKGIQKDIVNLMQLFTTDTIQLLKKDLDEELVRYQEIKLPTEKDTVDYNKNLKRLEELKEIEILTESIRKQLSTYFIEKIDDCIQTTELERIPKEVFALMGNQLLIV